MRSDGWWDGGEVRWMLVGCGLVYSYSHVQYLQHHHIYLRSHYQTGYLAIGRKLPINRPTIPIQKILTSSLEGIIRPEIIDRHPSPGDGINAGLLDILGDSETIE